MGESESGSAVGVEKGKEEMKKARTRGGYSGSVFALGAALALIFLGGCGNPPFSVDEMMSTSSAFQTSTASYQASLKSVWEASLHTVKGHGFRIDPTLIGNPRSYSQIWCMSRI